MEIPHSKNETEKIEEKAKRDHIEDQKAKRMVEEAKQTSLNALR
ncbi:hypothetical protein [Priestia endophytica]|nr:hypothetical protein [Priestia endophytica]